MSDCVTITEHYFRLPNGSVTRVRTVGKEVISIDPDFPIMLPDKADDHWHILVTPRELELLRGAQKGAKQ